MDLVIMFGKKSTALSEIFWETTENFIEEHGNNVMNLKSELLQEMAAF